MDASHFASFAGDTADFAFRMASVRYCYFLGLGISVILGVSVPVSRSLSIGTHGDRLFHPYRPESVPGQNRDRTGNEVRIQNLSSIAHRLPDSNR
jgi:hypothetical protein